MKVKFAVGIISCVLFVLPSFSAAYPKSSDSIRTKPYWSQPKSFWTPANAQKQLKEDADQATCVRIYGGGRLWQELTGLPTYTDTIGRSRLDPEARGIPIQDKQLIRLMPSLLQSSDKVLEGKYAVQADTLTIEMDRGLDQSGWDTGFSRWHGKAYCYRPRIDDMEMSSGNSIRFKGFIRKIARYAREHRHSVSFYRYNVYELSPT